ncbi:MAG: PP2C family protein-serine/threonine phosphatase, partial [Acidimicrobiales bacterium]
MTTIRAGAATDVGQVRANNQDQFLVAERIFAVADGMGGHAGGEVASATAIDTLRSSFGDQATADGLADAVRRANQA